MTGPLPEPVLPYVEIVLRLLMALACGAVIGLNREFHRKPAGFRTFGLVSIGSAVVGRVMELEPGTGADAGSRVIQGGRTGIGFLGAGVIFRRDSPSKVAGLTTAAAVWLTAGLGMAAGAGQYAIATAGVVSEPLLCSANHRADARALREESQGKPPDQRPADAPKDE
jgi:putative Mg2+ transporter-C (MgtC) family protein